VSTATRRRGAARRAAGAALACATLLAVAACRRSPASEKARLAARGDGLFFAEAPAFVPLSLESDLDAMGIRRLYVPAASLARDGRITPLPPPPTPFARPVVVTILGDPGAADQLSGATGAALAERWAGGFGAALAAARAWGDVVGLHLHIDPSPPQCEVLAATIRALKKTLGGIPVSVTVRGTEPPASWSPLVGAADELLVFSFGRRPELGGRLVLEIGEEFAKSMPLPFRLLVAPGGFGRTGDGSAWNGRFLADGAINSFSEDRALDFSFGQVLSDEAGTVYTFKARPGMRPADPRLSADGGAARFQTLPFSELARFLGMASRWSAPNLEGRVFLVDGLPRDRHLVGFEAVRSLLTGKSLGLRLETVGEADGTGPGWVEFSLRARSAGPTPTDLSRFNNWVQVRAEGGVFSSLRLGDFDRFELLSPEAEGYRPVPFGRAVVARLFEYLFAPGETLRAGPIRISGARPKVYVRWHLTGPDGKVAEGPESELALEAPKAEPKSDSAPQHLRRR
jgi:hypothetical protein